MCGREWVPYGKGVRQTAACVVTCRASIADRESSTGDPLVDRDWGSWTGDTQNCTGT